MMKLSSLSLRQRFVRWSLVLAFVITSIALLPQPAQASDNHCILPNGADLNERYGISEQIVNFFCTQVDSGEHWTAPGFLWFMNTSFEAVPEGFVPAGATPLEDFLAKFVGVKYVIDRGTLQERSYMFPASDKIWTGITPDGFPAVNGGTLSIANPLSVGEHTVQVYWVLSAMHCDGFVALAENCLPAGESLVGQTAFVVTPGAAQSQ